MINVIDEKFIGQLKESIRVASRIFRRINKLSTKFMEESIGKEYIDPAKVEDVTELMVLVSFMMGNMDNQAKIIMHSAIGKGFYKSIQDLKAVLTEAEPKIMSKYLDSLIDNDND